MRRVIVLTYCLLLSCWGYSQNLEKLGKEDAITVHGGLNFNTVNYWSEGMLARRDPFSWFASGNLNISILDVSLPFTYSVSNQGSKFTQPYNMVALHPTYKWFKSHIGITSMNFSQYTLAGHLFAGGGIELTPGKWQVKMMGGRLNKAIAYDPLTDNLNEITYQRYGYGLQTQYESEGYKIGVIFFKGKDQASSLDFVPLNSQVTPEDNAVISVLGGLPIGKKKKFRLDAEYAVSGLTQNQRDGDAVNNSQVFSFMNPLVGANGTTSYFSAYKTALSYTLKSVQFAFNFEHVDPGYKTLGAYFFNNDLENYTLSQNYKLFKGKLNLMANTGFQRNNLSQDNAATTRRWIGSINASAMPLKGLLTNVTYSNFNSFTKNRPASDPFYFQGADTLSYFQISQNGSAMVAYSFGKDKQKQTVQILANYQESQALSGQITAVGAFGVSDELPTGDPTRVFNTNAAYSLQLAGIDATAGVAANYTRTALANHLNEYLGPSLQMKKSLFEKKVGFAVGSTYNRQLINGIQSSNVFNHRLSFNYSPKFKNEKAGKINFSLNANYLQKLSVGTDPTISEVNVFMNIAYQI